MRTAQYCTKVILRAEVAMLGMKQRLWMEKVKFVQRLKRMENSLAKEVYEEQRNNDWPGLAKEVTEICREVGIEDVNEKEEPREKVEEGIFYHHYREMKKDMESKEKCSEIRHEDFREVQSYMKENSIEKSRTMFSLRAKMYNCRANMHGSYDKDDRGCLACTLAQGREEGREEDWVDEESQSHLTVCPHYAHQRTGLDITITEGMVAYFQSILKERDKK